MGWGWITKDKVGYDYDGQKMKQDCHNMVPIVFFIGGGSGKIYLGGMNQQSNRHLK